uniref:Uncharacterized protein n=1 Tax=Trichogramma kaykai TaxID=54128 RepID=A0ABD2WJL9_9HYME
MKEQFKEGFLGVKRTNKPFSRIPVDLTLEQTINADAGRKLTRITHITNSIGARQRWSINYGLRCALISTVMEQCELSIVQEETNDLLPQKMKKSKNHLNHFMSSVLYRFNPFSAATRKDVLVNICTVTDGSVQCQIMHDYKCQGHVKAATKIPFFVSRTNDHNTVVEQCDNTDTMIILLGKMMDVSDTVQVWLEFGTGNNRRFINMNECFKSLGLSICKAIPAFHSFTGSFNDIQNPARDSYESAVDVLQEFVCQMYATKKNGLAYCTRVNEARENLFIHNYGSAEHTEQFQKKLLSIDGCTLPPCKRELDQHILRASYISSFWSNANCEVLHDLDATEYGWTLNDAAYLFKWYEGKEMPD